MWGGHSCPTLLLGFCDFRPSSGFGHPCHCKANFNINTKINFNINTKINFNNGGQECPPHTGTRGGIHRLNPFILRSWLMAES